MCVCRDLYANAVLIIGFSLYTYIKVIKNVFMLNPKCFNTLLKTFNTWCWVKAMTQLHILNYACT